MDDLNLLLPKKPDRRDPAPIIHAYIVEKKTLRQIGRNWASPVSGSGKSSRQTG